VEVQRVREALDELGSASLEEGSGIPAACALTSSSAWKRSRFACRSLGRVGTVPSGRAGGGRTVGRACMVRCQQRSRRTRLRCWRRLT
jgi:hypothetical protein